MGAGTPPPPPVSIPRATDPPAVVAEPEPAPARPQLEIHAAADVSPEELLFNARPVIVFAPSPDDPAFVTQIDLLRRDPQALAQRDVVVLVDADPAAQSAWRSRLRPVNFSLVVLDKQGMVIERKPFPWTPREIGRAIDKTPEARSERVRAPSDG
ncbi:DUF4174 domain-containing protein [Paracoccus sp. Z118]|nr:DUF4174 domain-containing protein [Paracoccus sp. Z118]MBV0892323.1 DUF4174 domain-containing protein [Paracoccus sp. Z118]